MKLRYENGNQAILNFSHLGWHFHGIAHMSIYTLFPKFYQVLMAAILDAILNNWNQ